MDHFFVGQPGNPVASPRAGQDDCRRQYLRRRLCPNKISIGEYNYGGDDDISGGIAEADVLGVFGSQGVFSAALWPLNGNEPYIAGGMAMFRNYDGKGSTFGDISVSVSNPDPTDTSLYASDYSTSSARMALVAINKSTGNLTVQLPLPNAPSGQAAVQGRDLRPDRRQSHPAVRRKCRHHQPGQLQLHDAGLQRHHARPDRGLGLRLVCRRQWELEPDGKLDFTRRRAPGAQCHRRHSRDRRLDHGRSDDHAGQAANGRVFAVGNSASSTLGYTLSGTGTNTLTFNNAGNDARSR